MLEQIQRKVGPLPLWGWALAIGGSLLLFRIVTGRTGQSSARVQTTAAVPVGADATIPGSENSLIGRLTASDIATLRTILSVAPAASATEQPAISQPSGLGSDKLIADINDSPNYGNDSFGSYAPPITSEYPVN